MIRVPLVNPDNKKVIPMVTVATKKEPGKGEPPSPPDGRKEDTKILRYTLASGAIWGLILWGLIGSSGPEHLLLLGVLTASVLCVGALLHSSFPLASLGYSMLVGLIAILAVGAVSTLGNTVHTVFWQTIAAANL